jgi:hypothetical protein
MSPTYFSTLLHLVIILVEVDHVVGRMIPLMMKSGEASKLTQVRI